MQQLMRGLAALWLAAFSATVLAQARELPDFTRLVEDQGNAVVNISTTQAPRRPQAGGPGAVPQVPGMEDEEVLEFFRRFIPRQPGPGQGPGPGGRPESRSLGSGFILSNDDYILTNAHVVDGADEINVKLTDKREFKAKVIGADKRTDVALIKIEGASLPVVKFGDPNKLKVGEWVVAIGAPFGFENTVTAGIVSAKGRSLPQEVFVPFIQTDVAINPGNSGGPLFNMRGEVVGINSQIYSRTGGFMGLSFAIPIDVALDIQKQLREKGRGARPHRRGDPGSDARPRDLVRPRPAARRAGQLGGEGQPRGQGRHRGGGHHPRLRRQAGREPGRPAAHRRLHAPGLAVLGRGVAQGQDAEAQHQRRGAAGRPRRSGRPDGARQAQGRGAREPAGHRG